jgi:hypothetical protein
MAAVIEIPRGPITRERSGLTDYGDGYEARLLRWRDSALQQGLAELRENPEYEEISTYIDLIEGRMWEGVNMAAWDSRFTDNRIARAREEALAYLTDIKPTIEVRTHVPEYRQTAEVIKGVIQLEWKNRRMDQALEEVIDHALFGTGFWKVSCSYPGEFNILPCGIDTVVPIQQGRDIQDSTAVLYRCFKPPHFFKQRWRDRSIGIEREAEGIGLIGIQSNQYTRPWNINEYSWNSMSPSMRYHKVRQSPGSTVEDQASEFPLIQFQEYWIEDWHENETGSEVIVKDPYRSLDGHNYWYRVKPGERLYPRKRLVVFGGDRLMYDGPSPYWHGMMPFAKLRLNPVVWSSGGISAYRELKPLNRSLNQIGSGIEGVVKKAVNPVTITRDGAVNPTSWEKFFAGRPGAKLKLTPIANPATDVRFIDPPVLPGYVPQFQQYLIQTMREAAGSLDISSMSKKKQLPGGDTIEQFKDSMTAPRRRQLRNIEVFLEDAGKLAVPCVPQFFSKDQRMRMLGTEGLTTADVDYHPGSMTPWNAMPEEFHKNLAIEIVSGSMHSGSKDREKQMAVVLQRQGAISVRELHRRLEIGDSDKILKEIQQEHGEGLGGAPKKSGGKTTRGQKNGGGF